MNRILKYCLALLALFLMTPSQAETYENYFVRNTEGVITIYYKVCKNGDNCENAVPITLEQKNQKYAADPIPYERGAGVQLIKITDHNDQVIKEGETGCIIRNDKTKHPQGFIRFEGEAVKGKINCVVG